MYTALGKRVILFLLKKMFIFTCPRYSSVLRGRFIQQTQRSFKRAEDAARGFSWIIHGWNLSISTLSVFGQIRVCSAKEDTSSVSEKWQQKAAYTQDASRTASDSPTHVTSPPSTHLSLAICVSTLPWSVRRLPPPLPLSQPLYIFPSPQTPALR